METKTKHETKECLRCKTKFECKVGDVLNCQCAEVFLSKATLDFLDKTQYDCLCKSCLMALNAMVQKAQQEKMPRRNELKEGVHYYFENGFMIFTEYYHLLRGSCCQNGCRHCAYGFKKTDKRA